MSRKFFAKGAAAHGDPVLKQEAQERALPDWHTSSQATPETKTARRASLSRTDAETVLELAARLQSDAQNRLTLEDLETMAAERGISNRYVHEALKIEANSRRVQNGNAPLPQVRLSHSQVRTTCAVIGFYGLCLIALPTYLPTIMPLVQNLGMLFAAGIGYYLRYKRAGAIAGAVTAILYTLCMAAVFTMMSMGRPVPWEIYSVLAPSRVPLWMLAGAAGAALRQWIATRQLPYEPTVLTAPDLDR